MIRKKFYRKKRGNKKVNRVESISTPIFFPRYLRKFAKNQKCTSNKLFRISARAFFCALRFCRYEFECCISKKGENQFFPDISENPRKIENLA